MTTILIIIILKIFNINITNFSKYIINIKNIFCININLIIIIITKLIHKLTLLKIKLKIFII